MKNKYILIPITIVITNLLINFLLLPYVQKTVNMHVNENILWSIVLYFISATLLFGGIYILIKRKGYKMSLLLIIFAITFIFWGYKLYFLKCLGCLNSG